MNWRSFQKSLIRYVLLVSALASGHLWGTPYQLQYGGRLTSANGSPTLGPINLSINFFSTASGGTTTQSKSFSNVPLQDGVFSLSLNLTPSEYAQVFSTSDVWIEVQDLTNSKIYPRQHLSASPFAFRIPTDGITLSFDGNG